MVIETEVPTFSEWFPGASLYFLLVVAVVAAGVLAIGWLVAALRHGPKPAWKMTGRVLAAGAIDLSRISPRRVWALTWLAVKESIRRRVVVVFAVFILVLLFAGWFLDPGSPHPARLYLSFVLTATSYPMLLLALLISALSLPRDIKNQTLHTVVTKPVRPGEIVLGRIFGFTIIGTGLMVIMGTISYVFVIRGLSHIHQVDPADLDSAEESWSEQLAGGKLAGPLRFQTTEDHNHRHDFRIDPVVRTSGKDGPKTELNKRGWVRTSMERDHWHEVSYRTSDGDESKITCEIGPPQGRLVARVPIYGKLEFRDRSGNPAKKGVNVGDEWTYRSFIEGQTLATAIWTFEGITEANFPEARLGKGLPLEMTLEVFRTYKGKTDDPDKISLIPGSLTVRNPKTGLTSTRQPFTAKDFTTDVRDIPCELETPEGRQLDLFEDLAEEGRIEIHLRCEHRAQFFGAAQADVYFRARNASFTLNFAKGYLGIWLQMVLVISIGVMFSTFLSGPIALIATLGTLVGGFFSRFMSELAARTIPGGGPAEAFYRLITQQNVTSEMEPGLKTTVAEMVDRVAELGMAVAAAILPEFGRFSFADYVAYGFDISANVMLQCVCRALAFMVPVFVAGYFFLKTREVAR